MIQILLIEDDTTIANNVASFLTQHQFSVTTTYSLQQATQALETNHFHIILLDMMLPDGDGLTFSKSITPSSKIIFLTAVDDEKTIVDSFNDGAEDYITKPFRLPVLLARLHAVVKRYHLDTPQLESYYHLTIDRVNQCVFHHSTPITMSATEQKLFFYLYANRNHTLTREQLLNHLWDFKGDFVNDNTLTVTLKRLRKKIEATTPLITTIRGVGYQMKL